MEEYKTFGELQEFLREEEIVNAIYSYYRNKISYNRLSDRDIEVCEKLELLVFDEE